jgi:hypothetical protein
MIQLSTTIPTGLTWSRIPGSRNYQLKWNDEVAGTLQRPGWFSTSFLAETEEGRWIFRRGGCFRSGADILDAVSQQPIAALKQSWGGASTLSFTDGQTFKVDSKGWWRPIWSVLTESGLPILRLQRREKTVEVIDSASLPQGRLSLLVMFLWYRVLQSEEDGAAAVVVAAS